MYPSTFLDLSLSETGLILASTFLDYCQKLYIYQLLSLLKEYFTKQILPISLRIGNRNFQLRELPNNTLMWTQNT